METALFFSTIWRPGDIIIIIFLHIFSFFFLSYKLLSFRLFKYLSKSTYYIMAIGVQLTNYLVKVQTTKY